MPSHVNLVGTFYDHAVDIGLSAMCVLFYKFYNKVYSIFKADFYLLILSLQSKSRACSSSLAKEIKPRTH